MQKKKGSVETHIHNWGAGHSCNLPTSEQVSFGSGTKPVPNAVQNPAWPGCGSTQKQITLPCTEHTMETALPRKGLRPEQTSAVLSGASTAMLNLEFGKQHLSALPINCGVHPRASAREGEGEEGAEIATLPLQNH